MAFTSSYTDRLIQQSEYYYGTPDITFPSTASAVYFVGDGSGLTNLPAGPTPTLDAVTTAGATTTNDITVGDITASKFLGTELRSTTDLTIDADGADILLKDGGTEFGRLKRDTSDFIIKSAENDKDLIFRGVDNSVTITALTLDMSDAGSATFNNHIYASGNLTASNAILANLTVTGTASFQHTEDLDIADRFIKLASGSDTSGVGGIAVQQTSATDAQAFGWNNTTGRWGITSSFDASQNTFSPSAYMTVTVNGTDNDPNNVDSAYHKIGNMYIDTDAGIEGVWIYI